MTRRDHGAPRDRTACARGGQIRPEPIVIEDGVWTGAHVLVFRGRARAGCIVGAGAVVNRDVPPDTIAGGVPARVIRHLETEERHVP